MDTLITTQGTFERDEIDLLLPHEHIFADLGPMEEENWKDATAEPVIDLIGPEIERAKEAGIDALVECTPEGVGRRVDIDLAVSEATDFPVVVTTGIYQEPNTLICSDGYFLLTGVRSLLQHGQQRECG